MRSSAVELPGGHWRDGVRVTSTRLRNPTGYDEEWLASQPDELPLDRASELLARCVIDLGGRKPTRAEIDSLALGDREALLWQLRRKVRGDRVDVLLECPQCAEPLDLEVSLADVLEDRYEDWAPLFSDTIEGRSVDYRVPTALHVRSALESESVASIVEACVETIDGATPDVGEVPDDLVAAIGEAMAARDPQAEVRLESACPACGSSVTCVLDASSFTLEELARRGAFLTLEVHLLALHYHWSEDEILSLPTDRRAAYLSMISDAYEGASA